MKELAILMGTVKISVKNHPDLWVQINFSLIFSEIFEKMVKTCVFPEKDSIFIKLALGLYFGGVNRYSERIREKSLSKMVFSYF